jgi:hypothetical protein
MIASGSTREYVFAVAGYLAASIALVSVALGHIG